MTSWRWPPSTRHERPEERRFYIWQDPHIDYSDGFARNHGWERRPWRWCCTLCDPPACGFQVKKGAWNRIMTSTMPRHFRVRQGHHRHTAMVAVLKAAGSE
jgi:hypothetical protein